MTWLTNPQPGAPCAIIAEVAQAHDGSLGMAHAYIDAAAAANATAIKFQTHIAAAESTPAEPWRKRFSYQDATRYEYWRRMEFTPEQWAGLMVHAEAKGLIFLSSPFSMEAFELLRTIGVPAWKIASGEVSNTVLLAAMAQTGDPIMISSGMSDYAELDKAISLGRSGGSPVAAMQCSSIYPCPPEAIGLNLLDEYRQRYGTAVGLSDHSGKIFAGLAAATIGIEVLEVHITFSREMFGPDVVASVTSSELRTVVEGVRFIEKMKAQPLDRSSVPEDLVPLRAMFMKSAVAARDLVAGSCLSADMVTVKKPGGGIPADRLAELWGRRLRRAICADEKISLDDLE